MTHFTLILLDPESWCKDHRITGKHPRKTELFHTEPFAEEMKIDPLFVPFSQS
jgi:hypothetical protein